MMDQAQQLRDMMEKKRGSDIHVITVTSAKGGVGKSSVSLNLAIALSRRGRRVLLVDMDLGLANIDVMLGVRARHDLMNVIRDGMDIRDVMEEGQYGVHFISGGSGMVELLNMESDQLTTILESLMDMGDSVDTILFDTGAGINENILRLICASHETLLVTTPEPTAIMDAYALVKITGTREPQPNIRLIVNRADTEREARAASAGFIQIAQKYTNMKVTELGYILQDENVVKAVKLQVPLLISFPSSPAAQGIEQLADRWLMNPEQPARTGLAGFWERLLSRRGKPVEG